MTGHNPEDYTFLGLCNHGKPLGPVTSLAYLVGLVSSVENSILELQKARTVLAYLYDTEEQVEDASDLLDAQASMLPPEYYPQTPVMLTNGWSPLGDMLERRLGPLRLLRSQSHKAVATGVWKPLRLGPWVSRIPDCVTQEALFWAILSEAGRRATDRNMLISIIAFPGWSYEHPGILPSWDQAEISRADRILWRRSPKLGNP